jgi:hypothetical protein
VLNWINDWLGGREQRVVLDQFSVLSGVPRGSVLGLVFFVVHFEDIDGDINKIFLLELQTILKYLQWC